MRWCISCCRWQLERSGRIGVFWSSGRIQYMRFPLANAATQFIHLEYYKILERRRCASLCFTSASRNASCHIAHMDAYGTCVLCVFDQLLYGSNTWNAGEPTVTCCWLTTHLRRNFIKNSLYMACVYSVEGSCFLLWLWRYGEAVGDALSRFHAQSSRCVGLCDYWWTFMAPNGETVSQTRKTMRKRQVT